MPMPTGNGKIPNFTDSEKLKTPKTDCVQRQISLDSRFVDLESTGFSATLKDLSMKLVMLLSLSSASRVSDLASFDIRFQQFTPEGVRFFIPGLTKQDQVHQKKPFCRFSQHKSLLCEYSDLV